MAAPTNLLPQSSSAHFSSPSRRSSLSSNLLNSGRTSAESWQEFDPYGEPATFSVSSAVSKSNGNYVNEAAAFSLGHPSPSLNHEHHTPPAGPTPKCAVCLADSTGIHFGVESCSACAAFFRRSVVLRKTYTCPRDNACVIELDSQKRKQCRRCRYAACLRAGMDRQAVQGRRDAIGKYSSIFKRESASCNGACVDDCTCAKSKLKAQASALIESPESPRSESSLLTGQAVDETSGAPTSPSTPAVTYPLGSVLAELLAGYKELNRLRKIFYCRKSLQCLFDDSQELKPSELTDFNDAMFQLWRVEPRLSVNFIASISYLRSLPDIEKTRMFSNFLLNFHAIEEPYLTWKFGGLTGDQKFWMMPNRVYLCFDKAEQYFDTPNIMRGLKLDKTSAINLFKPSFQHAMETVGEKMALMDLREVEVVGLIGVVLFDPTCRNLRPETALLLNRLRNQLFSDLLDYYRTEQFEEPEVRLGNLIILLQGVKIHAIKSKENMELLRIFEIAPLDNLFEEIVGISTPP